MTQPVFGPLAPSDYTRPSVAPTQQQRCNGDLPVAMVCDLSHLQPGFSNRQYGLQRVETFAYIGRAPTYHTLIEAFRARRRPRSEILYAHWGLCARATQETVFTTCDSREARLPRNQHSILFGEVGAPQLTLVE